MYRTLTVSVNTTPPLRGTFTFTGQTGNLLNDDVEKQKVFATWRSGHKGKIEFSVSGDQYTGVWGGYTNSKSVYKFTGLTDKQSWYQAVFFVGVF